MKKFLVNNIKVGVKLRFANGAKSTVSDTWSICFDSGTLNITSIRIFTKCDEHSSKCLGQFRHDGRHQYDADFDIVEIDGEPLKRDDHHNN